jgi:hypothetical protein
MQHKDFSKIIKKIKDIINEGPMKLGAILPIEIFYNGECFTIFNVTEITQDESFYSSSPVITLTGLVIEKQDVKKPIFIELIKLINCCKKKFGHNDKFDNLIEELRKSVEFQDVLECL